MTQHLDDFETALLAELKQHVTERTPQPVRRRGPRRLVVGLGTVAAATVIALLVPGTGTTTAYSVLEGNSGEIHVKVDRMEDAEGLERALGEHGIRADVTYVEDGGQCLPGRYRVAPDQRGLRFTIGGDRFEVTLDPGAVRPGETLVIAASSVLLPPQPENENGISSSGGMRSWLEADVATGPVAPCVPVPATD